MTVVCSAFAAQGKSPEEVEREQGELLFAKYGLKPKAKLIQKVRVSVGCGHGRMISITPPVVG